MVMSDCRIPPVNAGVVECSSGMERNRFEELVAAAVDSLPEEFLSMLENVIVVVEDRPTRRQVRSSDVPPGDTLLGLYEGVPLTERYGDYGMAMPDKITIFQRPIEEMCRSDDEIADEVRRTVQHEIAHHFGIDDGRLDEMGR